MLNTVKCYLFSLFFLLQIDGKVTQSLNICLSKLQYEQLLECLSYATHINISKDAVGSSEHYEPEPSVETIKTDFTRPNISFRFNVPTLKLDLKNEFKTSIIHILFQEFSFQKIYTMKKAEILISLRSVVMEDLKFAQNSKLRNMVDSSNESDNLIKNKLSNSCPNLSSGTNYCCIDRYNSMPTVLNHGINIDTKTVNENTPIGKKNNLQASNTCEKENLVLYKSVTIKNIDERKNTEIKCSIDFNNLNLIISTEKWFIVFDFFGLISVPKENSDKQNNKAYSNCKYPIPKKIYINFINF